MYLPESLQHRLVPLASPHFVGVRHRWRDEPLDLGWRQLAPDQREPVHDPTREPAIAEARADLERGFPAAYHGARQV